MAAPPTDYNILSNLSNQTEMCSNEALMLSMAFTHSWQFNRRRMEGHTYTIWDIIFSAFAATYIRQFSQHPTNSPAFLAILTHHSALKLMVETHFPPYHALGEEQAERYALILFNDPLRNGQESVIIIAAAREWYAWRLMQKEEVRQISTCDEDEDDDFNDSDSDSDSDPEDDGRNWRANIHSKRAKETTKTEKDPDAESRQRNLFQQWRIAHDQGADEPAPHRFLDGIHDPTMDTISDVYPRPGYWSPKLHLGTPTSNQHMWYLHHYLTDIALKRDLGRTRS
ncbi:hypothetical protein BDN71DRAFT_1510061 [Pleurotus eryngii]|uniref:Uncharacterized protein n=1 Tax=Pleurotus eryngii TaxID=5323 RepID=A0A9P6D5C0_PLEER|nr:hypothetical protein BDN71DRAFT_1510061 [Pleurotus eryngii]